MKGLLIKDFYVLFRESKVFLLIVAVFCVFPNNFTRGFSIMYAAMLPFTTMAYDEQAKWDYYAEMMPYRRQDLVRSKYIVGILATLIVAVLQTAAALVYQVFRPEGLLSDQLFTILIYVCLGLLIMAVDLPILFKLGSEKGRMVYLLIMVIAALGVVSSVQMDLFIWHLPPVIFAAAGIVLVILALAASIRVSVKAYTARRV